MDPTQTVTIITALGTLIGFLAQYVATKQKSDNDMVERYKEDADREHELRIEAEKRADEEHQKRLDLEKKMEEK